MHINDIEKIAERIERIIREAYEFSKPRALVLDELSDFAIELYEEVEELDAHYNKMAEEQEYYNQFQ